MRLDELTEVTLNFRAMNTAIELLLYPAKAESERAVALSQQVESLFHETEATLSRFRPDSELSKLNQQGYLEHASEMLYRNIEDAIRLHTLTEGIFDITILDALEAAGYDRSFEGLKDYLRLIATRPIPAHTPQGSIQLDPQRRSITLPPGSRVDLGGIAKGSTVDRAAELLRENGITSFMVSAGGDMYLEGVPPQDERGWLVNIENEAPGFSGDITTLQVTNKAVATSSTTWRRWLINGQTHHHLIDPRTQQSADTGLAAVTIVADSVQMADVMAKTALILGPNQFARLKLKEKAQLSQILYVTLQGELIEG